MVLINIFYLSCMVFMASVRELNIDFARHPSYSKLCKSGDLRSSIFCGARIPRSSSPQRSRYIDWAITSASGNPLPNKISGLAQLRSLHGGYVGTTGKSGNYEGGTFTSGTMIVPSL
jgi:hypothetical protein